MLKESDPDNVERVVKLRDYFVFRNHLCCIFDLFSINLYEFIQQRKPRFTIIKVFEQVGQIFVLQGIRMATLSHPSKDVVLIAIRRLLIVDLGLGGFNI